MGKKKQLPHNKRQHLEPEDEDDTFDPNIELAGGSDDDDNGEGIEGVEEGSDLDDEDDGEGWEEASDLDEEDKILLGGAISDDEDDEDEGEAEGDASEDKNYVGFIEDKSDDDNEDENTFSSGELTSGMSSDGSSKSNGSKKQKPQSKQGVSKGDRKEKAPAGTKADIKAKGDKGNAKAVKANKGKTGSDSEGLSTALEGVTIGSAQDGAAKGKKKKVLKTLPTGTDFLRNAHRTIRKTEIKPGDRPPVNYADCSDSSEDESINNVVGDIPLWWYDDHDHIGYDRSGNKIIRGPKKDSIDAYLEQQDNPAYWRTVYDALNDKEIVLSKEEIAKVKAILQHRFPAGYEQYTEMEDTEYEDKIHPVTSNIPSKHHFIKRKFDKNEEPIIRKLVKSIRRGFIKLPDKAVKKEEKPKYFDLWDPANQPPPKVNEFGEIVQKKEYVPRGRVQAPKMVIPGTIASYNPPREYLFSKSEKREWEEDPHGRRIKFEPKKYDRLRHVPRYSRQIKDQFERLLDLYLAPRTRKVRKALPKNTEGLFVSKLPKPEDLKPFPMGQGNKYLGHTKRIRSISLSPSGQWLASGSDDRTVRVWEVLTGRCIGLWKTNSIVYKVSWNPNPNINIIGVCTEDEVLFIAPDKQIRSEPTDTVLDLLSNDKPLHNQDNWVLQWEYATEEELEQGIYLTIKHPKYVKNMSWHPKGDYFATIMPDAESKAVHIHQLSKRTSQTPFKKSFQTVTDVQFHSSKPFLFVSSKSIIRVYNLVTQTRVKLLTSRMKWISSVDIHPQGDNIIVSSCCGRVSWFDLDLSTKPFKILRCHTAAARKAAYHKRFPIFASASDDGTIHVFHGQVYNDYLKNALIVPLRVLRGHTIKGDLGVLDLVWHPVQPWVFSSGADGTIRVWTDTA